MEEGVVGGLLNGPLGEVFDNQQLLTDVSGSGNNWYMHVRNIHNGSLWLCFNFRAVGNKIYGTKYHERLLDTLRKSAEMCDCLQSFFILHSMGGGGGVSLVM